MARSRPVKFKVQHYIDIQTSADSMQIINFSVGGEELMRRCAHLIGAYRYFKLGGIKVKFCAASSLPMDPLGLSYDDDDPQTVDPRDQLSPGLVRITNGEDILTDITGMDAETQDKVYQAMMLDPRWFKFGLQSGFQRYARPIWYQIGQFHQDIYPGAVINLPYNYRFENTLTPETDYLNINTDVLHDHVFGEGSTQVPNGSGYATSYPHQYNTGSNPRGFFQTGQKGRFGWLRTDAYQEIGTHDGVMRQAMLTPFPEVRCLTCVLPKMRKTLYYYRVYITETVYFSGVRHFSPATTDVSGADVITRALDDFAWPSLYVAKPGTSFDPLPNYPNDYNSGEDTDE